MIDWTQKRVLVTGGHGFLGRHVVAALSARGCRDILCPTSAECDLVDGQAIRHLLAREKPQLVIHLAARVGGIGANQRQPASFFYQNIMMGVQLLHEAWAAGVEQLVATATICAYPRDTPVPFSEQRIWDGYPEETNAPYGLAKKMLTVQSAAYRQQYGFRSSVVYPVNLYGPGDTSIWRTATSFRPCCGGCTRRNRRGSLR